MIIHRTQYQTNTKYADNTKHAVWQCYTCANIYDVTFSRCLFYEIIIIYNRPEVYWKYEYASGNATYSTVSFIYVLIFTHAVSLTNSILS